VVETWHDPSCATCRAGGKELQDAGLELRERRHPDGTAVIGRDTGSITVTLERG